jgi:hypothetical protein
MITANSNLRGRLSERPKSCVWCGRPTAWRWRRDDLLKSREVPACMILHAERGLRSEAA